MRLPSSMFTLSGWAGAATHAVVALRHVAVRACRLPPALLNHDPASAAVHPGPASLLGTPLLPRTQVQRCTLLSIKTGGCPENCGYCSQSSHWSATTGTKAEKLMDLEPVYEVGRGELNSIMDSVCV